jgi:hypothetical protein
MSNGRTQDYKWLESHINAASTEVASWPSWKSQSSTRGNCINTESNSNAKPESSPNDSTTKQNTR